jgi:hypothetical protein
MKNYSKAKMIAKNLATGSYAAGCPEKDRGNDRNVLEKGGLIKTGCLNCERTK